MSQRLFYPLSVGLVVGLLFLSNCAPKKKTNSVAQSSRGTSGTINDTQYKLAECNRIDVPQIGLKGQISTYYDSFGQLLPSYLNSNWSTVPTNILNGSQTLQIFRWSERVSGQRQTNSIPVTVYFIQKATGAISNPNGSQAVSKSILESIITQKSLGPLGITVQNFFERHFVILTGMETQWDAALFVTYANGVSMASGSVLLPAFYSNPNVYAQANASTELQSLHPNAQYRATAASETDYFNLTEQICSGFFGNVRIMASIEPKTEIHFFDRLKKLVTGFLNYFFGL